MLLKKQNNLSVVGLCILTTRWQRVTEFRCSGGMNSLLLADCDFLFLSVMNEQTEVATQPLRETENEGNSLSSHIFELQLQVGGASTCQSGTSAD